MKKRTDKNYSLFPVLILAVIIFSLLLNGCSDNQEGKPVPKRVIPEKDFISILTDLYLTDGLLTVSQIRDMFPGKDSVATYIDIITGHGYTKEAMDMTLEYYFVKRPKRLIKIYDHILGKLTEMDTRLANSPDETATIIINEWKGLPSYSYPDHSGFEVPQFNFKLLSNRHYSLIFTVTVYPFDQTANPGFTAWFCNADSSETGKRFYLPSIKYINDGYPHTYSVEGINERNYAVVFKGNLYDIENNPEVGERYGRIESIQYISEGN